MRIVAGTSGGIVGFFAGNYGSITPTETISGTTGSPRQTGIISQILDGTPAAGTFRVAWRLLTPTLSHAKENHFQQITINGETYQMADASFSTTLVGGGTAVLAAWEWPMSSPILINGNTYDVHLI